MVAEMKWPRLLPVFLHPYRAYLAMHRERGDTVRTRLPSGASLVFTIDDALVHHVLVEHPTAFIRPRELVESIFLPTVGDEVVAGNGAAWRARRDVAEARLDREAWRTGLAVLARTVDEFVGEVRPHVNRGVVDVLPAIERFVLAAALRLVCGREPSEAGDELASAMAYVMKATQELGDVRKRGFLYSVAPRLRDLLDGKRLAEMERCVGIIARFEPDGGRRELLLATYENPSTLLTWTLQFLAREPRCRERIRQEARTSFALHGAMTEAGLDALDYTEAAIREAARLRPAIAYLVRDAIEDTQFAGELIPKGTTITIVPYCVHVDGRRWRDPTRYEPERFLDETPHPLRHRFLAFGVGPRACVGTRFAMRILKGALAQLALEVDWTAAPDHVLPEPSGRFPWSEKIECPVAIE